MLQTTYYCTSFFVHFIPQLNDSESLKKFPSKSCSLRYGVAKIQEDALNLFHAGLREYVGVYHEKLKESMQQEWAITGLSVSASKIVDIPTVSRSHFVPHAAHLYCSIYLLIGMLLSVHVARFPLT